MFLRFIYTPYLFSVLLLLSMLSLSFSLSLSLSIFFVFFLRASPILDPAGTRALLLHTRTNHTLVFFIIIGLNLARVFCYLNAYDYFPFDFRTLLDLVLLQEKNVFLAVI